MSISFIVMEGNYVAIDAVYYICHIYYIMRFYSYPYILQSGLSISGQIFSFRENLCTLNVRYGFYIY